MRDPEKPQSVKAFAPATVANVGCGFDVLGFALHKLGDFVTATMMDTPGVRISRITGDGGMLPLDAEKNTAGLSVLKLLNELGMNDIGIDLVIEKKMPLGSGLGSSAASSVAAAYAVNKLLEEPFSLPELLPFTVEGEMAASGTPHADNAAAALFGGFILVKTHLPPDVISLPTPPDLFCTIIHPKIEIQTRHSRQILKKDVALEKAVSQWANVGSLVAALFKEDYDLIGRSLHDEIIEPVRSVLIPGFDRMKLAAEEAGALGCSISGSGPSLFALSRGKETARKAASAMGSELQKLGLEYNDLISSVNTQGATTVEEKASS
ncbi:homoserine kinase [Rhodohalobacter mucosus]|uniref:Homoserine kinase n=1 Tax=Rhodohalobacter mucosus TaxID=2079485 RepID=A0A316TZ11_9BACT|nr:homoserine kinase [Rhodohalobacter mucosus]PWN08114.1 homoserine kinase [Rhodohalobacter mucosus]